MVATAVVVVLKSGVQTGTWSRFSVAWNIFRRVMRVNVVVQGTVVMMTMGVNVPAGGRELNVPARNNHDREEQAEPESDDAVPDIPHRVTW